MPMRNDQQDLEEQQIAYKLADNGTTILIDKDQVDEYRINLAVDNKLQIPVQALNYLMMPT